MPYCNVDGEPLQIGSLTEAWDKDVYTIEKETGTRHQFRTRENFKGTKGRAACVFADTFLKDDTMANTVTPKGTPMPPSRKEVSESSGSTTAQRSVFRDDSLDADELHAMIAIEDEDTVMPTAAQRRFAGFADSMSAAMASMAREKQLKESQDAYSIFACY